MAEFGRERHNVGGNETLQDTQRLNPTLSSFTEHFNGFDISLTLYTDADFEIITDIPVNIIKVDNPIYWPGIYRYGSKCNDYYKVKGLLESKADYAISMDSDMYIVNKEVMTLLPLTKKFGICLPENPRLQVRKDGANGADGDYHWGSEDGTRGNGMANNMSPISLFTKSDRGRSLLEHYCKEMEEHPVRGPLAMWRASWKSGVNPYMLPFQWCVCDCGIGTGNIIGLENPIILHVGHKKVMDHYLKVKKFEEEGKRVLKLAKESKGKSDE